MSTNNFNNEHNQINKENNHNKWFWIGLIAVVGIIAFFIINTPSTETRIKNLVNESLSVSNNLIEVNERDLRINISEDQATVTVLNAYRYYSSEKYGDLDEIQFKCFNQDGWDCSKPIVKDEIQISYLVNESLSDSNNSIKVNERDLKIDISEDQAIVTVFNAHQYYNSKKYGDIDEIQFECFNKNNWNCDNPIVQPVEFSEKDKLEYADFINRYYTSDIREDIFSLHIFEVSPGTVTPNEYAQGINARTCLHIYYWREKEDFTGGFSSERDSSTILRDVEIGRINPKVESWTVWRRGDVWLKPNTQHFFFNLKTNWREAECEPEYWDGVFYTPEGWFNQVKTVLQERGEPIPPAWPDLNGLNEKTMSEIHDEYNKYKSENE